MITSQRRSCCLAVIFVIICLSTLFPSLSKAFCCLPTVTTTTTTADSKSLFVGKGRDNFQRRRRRRCHHQLFSSSSSSSNNKNNNLQDFFKPDFQNVVSKLSSNGIVDMVPPTTTTTTSTNTNTNSQPLRQQLFTSPLISVLYERVLPPLWEAGLRIGGPEEEYKAAANFLLLQEEEQEQQQQQNNKSNNSPSSSVLLDLSCGTGFVGQRFALAQQYDHVFSLDYSPQMLRELISSLQRQSLPPNRLSIIRGDAMNLPFVDNSLSAIHWGAAMHCVPNAEQALQEVYRVLKPGGGYTLRLF